MNNSKYTLWEGRHNLPRLGVAASVIALITMAGLSALTAIGWGGMPCISIAGAVFAFLLCSRRDIIPWISLPLSFAVAFLISGDLLTGVAALLFVPMGILLSYTVFTKRNLSVTVVALTAVILISRALYLTLSVTQIYGGGIRESYLAFASELEVTTREVFSLFRYEDASGEEIFALSDEDINTLIETVVMLLPGVIAVTCQLMAYGAAKLTRLFSHIFGFDCLFEGRPYAVTLSAPAGAIFVASYAISFLSREASVIAYAALNLTYILMPLSAIAGFHFIFGKGGIFRQPLPKSTRIIFIVTCAFCVFMSPFSFIPLLSVFGSVGALSRAITAHLRSRRDENGDR